MTDIVHHNSQVVDDIERVYKLGLTRIKHSNYKHYTIIQVWAVGLGTLIGNHDVYNYDPATHSGIELLVLALRDKFKNIGGMDIHVIEYLTLLKKHYPENVDDALFLSVVSSSSSTVLTPVIITDTYHPSILQIYTLTYRDIYNVNVIPTDSQLGKLRTLVKESAYAIIVEMRDNRSR